MSDYFSSEFFRGINALIAERIRYGIREEVASASGYILMWSNAARGWTRAYYKTPKGERLRLDANEIFVVGKKGDIDAVISELDELPLFSNSFEARFGKHAGKV